MEPVFSIRALQQPEVALQRHNFIEILLWHGFYLVSLLYISMPFYKQTSAGLLRNSFSRLAFMHNDNFFSILWCTRTTTTRMHVPNPILLLTVAVRFSTYAYKCNDIFCPNKVWITEMNNLFWILLFFFELF